MTCHAVGDKWMQDYEQVHKLTEGELEDRRAGRLLLHRAFYCSLPAAAPPVQACKERGLTCSQYADTFTAWELVDTEADKAAADAYRSNLTDFFTHGLDFSKDAVVQATDPSSAFHDQAIDKNKQPRPKVMRELWASLTDLTLPDNSKYKQQSDCKRSAITNSLVFFALDTVSALHAPLIILPWLPCITYYCATLVVCCTALYIYYTTLTVDLCCVHCCCNMCIGHADASTMQCICCTALHAHASTVQCIHPHCVHWSLVSCTTKLSLLQCALVCFGAQ